LGKRTLLRYYEKPDYAEDKDVLGYEDKFFYGRKYYVKFDENGADNCKFTQDVYISNTKDCIEK
jgi:hypothetical protein